MEIAGCFGRDGDVAICWFGLRLTQLSAGTGGRHCWERKGSRLEVSGLLLIRKSAVGDERDSMESLAGLAIALMLILRRGGRRGMSHNAINCCVDK